jgi:hypothetical protein
MASGVVDLVRDGAGQAADRGEFSLWMRHLSFLLRGDLEMTAAMASTMPSRVVDGGSTFGTDARRAGGDSLQEKVSDGMAAGDLLRSRRPLRGGFSDAAAEDRLRGRPRSRIDDR